MSSDWLTAAAELLEHESAVVRITVAAVRGSSPREPGATMLIGARAQWGTIGGGHLEWQAQEQARRLLAEGSAPTVHIEELRLGPDLAQCCGGAVSLWFERIPARARDELQAVLASRRTDGSLQFCTHQRAGTVLHEVLDKPLSLPGCVLRRVPEGAELAECWMRPGRELWIFGAGHIGKAVVKLLEDLPLFRITWVDNRVALLPETPAPPVRTRYTPEPVELVATAAPDSAFLVLTHDHELDFQLCAAILARGDAAWIGLIGSRSKAARFRSRLHRAGMPDESIAQMHCPVGMPSIRSKLPAAIAVGIVAQLLGFTTQRAAAVAAVPAAGCDPECGRCSEAAALRDAALAAETPS